MLALGLMAGHAGWCRLRHVRSPKTMLVLDTNAWGWIMVMAGVPVVSVAILTFPFVLVVLFSGCGWRFGLLAVSAGWFAVSAFTSEFAPLHIGHVLGVLLMTGGLAAMISRVRSWLDRLDAGRSQMLGTVSHELRNNLTGMIGLTDLVGTQPDMTFDEAKELVALTHQQAVDASEIVEDLLTVTRLQRSALTVTIEPISVNDQVETTVRRFAGEGTSLKVENRTDLPPANADALRVRQILRNFVSNAVRYGGPSIRITTRMVDGRIEIVVADDGDGVPPADEKRSSFRTDDPQRRLTPRRWAWDCGSPNNWLRQWEDPSSIAGWTGGPSSNSDSRFVQGRTLLCPYRSLWLLDRIVQAPCSPNRQARPFWDGSGERSARDLR